MKLKKYPLPITKLIDDYYADVQKMGGQRWDTSSLIKDLGSRVCNQCTTKTLRKFKRNYGQCLMML